VFRDRRFPRLARYGQICKPTLTYWMETEVHVYGFSIAANVLLSFFPFLIVMVSFCRYFLNWKAAESAIYVALFDYFPGETGDFLVRNLEATVNSHGPFQLMSLFLLLFTANGIFEPLEVALNRVWGITKNRSYIRNQMVSLGLIFLCGSLALVSTMFTAMNQELFEKLTGRNVRMMSVIGSAFFKMAAVPVSIVMLFMIYWLLPNRRTPASKLIAVSIMVGIALEGMKYINLVIWPYIYSKLHGEYGPFVNSVTIILWSFVAAMIVLAGAEWAARNTGAAEHGIAAGVSKETGAE
jgi:uncharacterized BrkB/YihY/UPF0761 family membrane protein